MYYNQELIHYGVKGMKWGERKSRRHARKDAKEFARAKMFYGEGAGNRRKLIKAKVETRKKNDPIYEKEFNDRLNSQNMEKHASKAKRERKRKDTTTATVKTTRGVYRALTGSFGTVTMSAAAIAAGAQYAHSTGLDQMVYKKGKTSLRKVKTQYNMKKMGL